MRILFGLLVAIVFSVPAAAACPNMGLKRQPVTLMVAKGPQRYTLDIAGSPDEQACGLMFREMMPSDTGMIFPFKPARDTAFWMRNTPLALDLIFVGPDNRVISVGKGVPFSEALIPAGGVTAHVIELNYGEAARIGLKKGDRVKIGW